MVEGVFFIGAVIVAVTELVKYFVKSVDGPISILVAAGVGIVVALLDTTIGVTDMSVAEGLMTGLGAAGTVAVAKKVNTGTGTEGAR